MTKVCPECESLLVVGLNEPWEHPEVFRCMLCGSTFVDGAPVPALMGGRGIEALRLPAAQVKIRIIVGGGLVDPLRWARDGARRLERGGDLIAAAGVGAVREAPDGTTEITFLLLVRGLADLVEASERAHRRVAQTLGGDPVVMDIQTAAAVPLYADLDGRGEHRSAFVGADSRVLRGLEAR